MEELFPVLIIIIGAIVSISNSSKKEKEKQAAKQRHQAAAAARIQAAQQKLRQQAAAQPARHAQPKVTPPSADLPGQVIVPTVHTHLQPDCSVHDQTGSMDYVSTEGKDPCHAAQLTHVRTAVETAPEAGGLTLDWSGEGLVKAFVMQEVLKRPCERRAR